MDFIKHYFTQILNWLDNGSFFIKPLKWIFTITAWLSYVLPLGLIYYVISEVDLPSGWAKLMAVLFIFIFIIVLSLAAYLNYIFWINRREKIDDKVKTGDQIVAIPLLAHYIQSFGESFGLLLGIIPPIALDLIYVWSIFAGDLDIITDYIDADNVLLILLGGLIGIILLSILFIFMGFGIVLLGRVTSEQLRNNAQIANDVRDLRKQLCQPSAENPYQGRGNEEDEVPPVPRVY